MPVSLGVITLGITGFRSTTQATLALAHLETSQRRESCYFYSFLAMQKVRNVLRGLCLLFYLFWQLGAVSDGPSRLLNQGSKVFNLGKQQYVLFESVSESKAGCESESVLQQHAKH